MNANPVNKGIVDSMLDRDRRPGHIFEEAHERIPSSVGLAEGEYRYLLRKESHKHERDGVGFFEWGGTEKEDWRYQHWFAP